MPERGAFRSLLIGVDGSATSRQAVSFVTRLTPPAGGRATVLRVIEPMNPGPVGILPRSVRTAIAGQAAAVEAEATRVARRDVDRAVARLAEAGWLAEGEVALGRPLDELLRVASRRGADLLVLGAGGKGAVERLLLGSTADAAVKRSPLPVLIVK